MTTQIANPENCLVVENIDKVYPGTKALNNVSYELKRGRVNVLIGENGAGKSTLMKLIAGIEQPTSGHIYMDGEEVHFASTSDAKAKGIAIIHQELSLYPNMNIFQNMFVGSEICTRQGLLNDAEHARIAAEVLERLEHPMDPATPVANLSVGEKQIVEIARNLTNPNLRVLIMDEPTSSLSAQEVGTLFKIIRDLKERGITIVYISHRLEEIMQIGDRVTILRDGNIVASAEVKDISVDWIVEKMVGSNRTYEALPRNIDWSSRKAVMKLSNITLPKAGGGYLLDDVSLEVKEGEILGVYGLLGAGRTELLECVMGLRPEHSGKMELNGAPMQAEDISRQVEKGLVIVPEDRQKEGLVQTLNIQKNTVLSSLRAMVRRGRISNRVEADATHRMVKELHIKVADKTLPILSLSGGNQQKVVIAKGILTNPKVLLLDEPSRGIDVGAKAEVFDIIRQCADQGLAIIMVSSELKEVLSVADRVVVLSNGKVTGNFCKEEMTEQTLVNASYLGHGNHSHSESRCQA